MSTLDRCNKVGSPRNDYSLAARGTAMHRCDCCDFLELILAPDQRKYNYVILYVRNVQSSSTHDTLRSIHEDSYSLQGSSAGSHVT